MTALLEVNDLVVSYAQRGRQRVARPAVDEVSFSIDEGESVGLVGESGSGKSTIGRALLGLVRPQSGRIVFDQTDVTNLGAEDRGALASRMQIVFQDPRGSLNPMRSVGQSLHEAMPRQGRDNSEDADRRMVEVLARVGLSGDAVHRYPSEFSGGQRQRVVIARALVAEPRLIICDEPVSALDVSTQSQVLNLFDDLRQQSGHSYLFIGHNLPLVRHITQRLVVLFRGQVMESGRSTALMDMPLHPYTQALVSAVPVADVQAQRARRDERHMLLKAPDTEVTSDAGCPFAPRCPFVAPVCFERRPNLAAIGESSVACHRYTPESGHPSPISTNGSKSAGTTVV